MTRPTALRALATVAVAAALAVLVAIRVIGDESDATRAGGTTTVPAVAATTTTAVELPLPDPPSKVTPAQLAGVRFTDVTAAAGLDRRHADLAQAADMSMTSGAAVADVDGDGDLDLYVTRVGLPNSLYRNDGTGRFTDVAVAAGVDRTPPPGGFQGSGAAAFADVDANGCPDLYVTGVGARNGETTLQGEAALFVNDCRGRFRDETAARGVALPPTDSGLGAQGHGATFADVDHDGDLDLLALHWDPAFLGGEAGAKAYESHPDPRSLCERTATTRKGGMDRTPAAGPNRSRLFRNDGTGHFTDATTELGLPLERIAAFTGDFVDVDDDGWEDLLVTGDFCTSRLFRNDGGRRFVDVTDEAKVGTDENGMGSVVRDVDGDGRPDWFVTGIDLRTTSGACATRVGNTACSGNRLYLNRGGGRFRDATDEFGVRDGWWGWGAAIEDFGNDGRLAFAQTNGYFGEDAPRDRFATDPDRLWIPADPARPDARRARVDAATAAGLDGTGVGHALVAFDADGDGDLDLFVANYGDPPHLYRNDTPARHWLTVRLDDPTRPGNRQGLGAKVRVTVDGQRTVSGWISTGGSYETQKPAELHVGLGDRGEPVDRIEVWWPGATEPQVLADVAIDRVLTVTRS